MSSFGLQQDLHECLLHIHSKYPDNLFILLGDSAGTGFWVRYTGDLALLCDSKAMQKFKMKSPSNTVIPLEHAQTISDQLLCGIMISPGYDIGKVFGNMHGFAQRLILSLMKQTFVQNHRDILIRNNESVITKCEATTDLVTFFETYFGAMSGYKSYEEWLRGTNPTDTAEFVQCPALIINAKDDPICTKDTVNQWKWLFTQSEACPNAIMLETKYGSHCGFLNAFGGFWLDNIILEYVKTVYDLRVSAETAGGNNTDSGM